MGTIKKPAREVYRYTYDTDGQLTEVEYQYYVTFNQEKLKETRKTIYQNGVEHEVHFYDEDYGWRLYKEYFYDENGYLKTVKLYYSEDSYQTRKEGIIDQSGWTLHTNTSEYETDSHGNLIRSIEREIFYTYETTYEYVLEDDYVEEGLLDTEIGNSIGTSKCGICREEGYSRCQGHTCPVCEGVGTTTCNGCHGTGKGPMILGSDDCRVCYGLTWQICPNCDGARKTFND